MEIHLTATECHLSRSARGVKLEGLRYSAVKVP